MARQNRLPPARRRLQMDCSLAIVNIVLLLIFFFLTTGSLSNSQKVVVTLPDTSTLPLDLLPKPLLAVDTQGDMTLDGAPVTRDNLAVALGDSPTLHVLADRSGNAGALLDVLADANLIAVQVRLVTVHRKIAKDAE